MKEVASAVALPEAAWKVRYDHSGQLVFRDRVNWALTRLRERGLLANPYRGVWEITEDGTAVNNADALAKKRPRLPATIAGELTVAGRRGQRAFPRPRI